MSTLIAETRASNNEQSVDAGASKIVKTTLVESSDTDNIVVVDGIGSPREFSTSEKINKELSKFRETQHKTERAYRLPRLVLHYILRKEKTVISLFRISLKVLLAL